MPALYDMDVRRALFKTVLAGDVADKDTLIVEELGLRHGKVRIDIAVINGHTHGFEIKSERDTLRRLDRQAQAYGAVLDQVTLVTAPKHLDKARAVVPEWWGIMQATSNAQGDVVFNEVREAGHNNDVDVMRLLELLWSNEARQLLEDFGAARGYRGKSRAKMYARLAEVASLDELRDAIRRIIKTRRGWRDHLAPTLSGG